MISSLAGTVAEVGLSWAVIEVGGVGMQVYATPATLGALQRGKKATVKTLLVVREDSLTLYGFAQSNERDVFETLTSISGVGPRLALAVLAVLSPEAITTAVTEGDAKALTKVPGIGPKVASRIVLELAGKLVPLSADDTQAGIQEEQWQDQVVAALKSLGWNEKDAKKSVKQILTEQPELAEARDVAQTLRATLAWLGQDTARTKVATGA